MARFFRFYLTVFLLLMFNRNVMALGVDDFVAVADSPTAAVYNPAGLAEIAKHTMYWEHRFTKRDVAFGRDDLAVYAAADERGCGALYVAYSQDRVATNLYNRIQTLGYSYGWKINNQIFFGLSGKMNELGRYDNSSGMMVKQTALSNEVVLDLGMLFTPREHWYIGCAFHNIGRSEAVQIENSQATLGISYQNDRLTAAFEIYDFLNEGSGSLEGSLLRTGVKFNLLPNILIHGVVEKSSSDWDYTGKLAAIQWRTESLSFTVSWYQAECKYICDDTLQAGVGFTF